MAVRNMQQFFNSWNTRDLISGFQRAEILEIFVLPKMYSLAECLPLPPPGQGYWEADLQVVKIGKMEMISLEVMCNPIN